MLCNADIEIIELCLNATRTHLIRSSTLNEDLDAYQKKRCDERVKQIEKTLDKVRRLK